MIVVYLLTLCMSFSITFAEKTINHGYEKRIITTPCSAIAHIFSFDPTLNLVELAKANSQCRGISTTSDLVKKHHAFAGINGGFSLTDGTPSGICVINKQWISAQKLPRAAIGWSKTLRNWIFDIIDTKKTLLINNSEFPVDFFNAPHNINQASIYSSLYDATTGTNSDSVEFIVKDNVIIARSEMGNSPIGKPEEFVYSIGKEALTRIPHPINIGDHVSFSIKIIPQSTKADDWENLDFIIDGTPLLIFEEKIVDDFSREKVAKNFITEKYARSAIGLIEKDDSYDIVLVVVECTSTPDNQGMTLAELAAFMKNLGCSYAVNLSGGSSSTMIYKEKMVNIPQQKGLFGFSLFLGEKEVSNALVIGAPCEPLS